MKARFTLQSTTNQSFRVTCSSHNESRKQDVVKQIKCVRNSKLYPITYFKKSEMDMIILNIFQFRYINIGLTISSVLVYITAAWINVIPVTVLQTSGVAFIACSINWIYRLTIRQLNSTPDLKNL